MRFFLQNILLFMVPLILLFTPATAILFSVGEFYSPEKLGEFARGSQTLVVGNAYSNVRSDYQLQETLVRQPQVIALGTSRVGGFRSVFFKDPSVFYNGTGVGGVLSNFRYFIEKNSNHPPRLIIAGMDPYFFNPEEKKNEVVMRPDPFLEHIPGYGPFFGSLFQGGGWWKVFPDYAAGKFKLRDVFGTQLTEARYVGLRAVADGNGFLNDGSNYFGDVIRSQERQQEARVSIDALAARISDSYGDEYGSGISPEALVEVRRFLDTAKTQGSIVIGFIPPMSHAEYERLKAFPDAPYAFAFKNLGPVLKDLYKEYGFDFYDFSDLTSFGGSDAEMVESKHGSEKLYVRLFIHMAKRNKQLGELVDVRFLEEKLMDTKSSLEVFPL